MSFPLSRLYLSLSLSPVSVSLSPLHSKQADGSDEDRRHPGAVVSDRALVVGCPACTVEPYGTGTSAFLPFSITLLPRQTSACPSPSSPPFPAPLILNSNSACVQICVAQRRAFQEDSSRILLRVAKLSRNLQLCGGPAMDTRYAASAIERRQHGMHFATWVMTEG